MPTFPDLLLGVRLPSQGGAPPPSRVILAGDLKGLPFADLVNLLAQARKTGVLRVLSPSGERTLVLESGEIRGASSTHPGDRLGELAVRMGLLGRAELESVLGEPNAGRRLGRLLVERKLLTAHQLWQVLQEQVSSIFQTMLLEERGTFLLADEPVRGAATSVGIPAQALLMDGLRRLDELGHFRSRIPSSHAQVRLASLPEISLTGQQRELLRMLERGTQTPLQLAEALRLPEFEVTRLLFHLAEAGFLVVSEHGPERFSDLRPHAAAQRPICRVFNQILREIFAEGRREAPSLDLRAEASAMLAPGGAADPLLHGVVLGPDGAFDEELLLARVTSLDVDEGRERLLSSLQALMYFLLFALGEHLSPTRDEDLNRRVKVVFGTLEE